jgi:hypothetical protein
VTGSYSLGNLSPNMQHTTKRDAWQRCRSASEIDCASRGKSPKANRTFGDLPLIEGQASRCAIRIDAAAKTIAA